MGHGYLSERTLAHFEDSLANVTWLGWRPEDNSASSSAANHEITGRSRKQEEFTRTISEALSDSWNTVDNLLISDALSSVRTPECQEVCIRSFKLWVVSLTNINLKLDML